MTRYGVNDLARYSSWPARLIGLEPWEPRVKTAEEIDREYGVQKWGGLLARARQAGKGATLQAVDAWVDEGAEPSLVSVGENLVLMTPAAAHKAYVDFVATELHDFLPATALVELGAGYGSVVLGLAAREEFKGIPTIAADFTSTGPELTALIAANEGLDVSVGQCDFAASPLTSMEIPAGALIYTAYSAACLDTLGNSFLDGLAALSPKIVIHLESAYEHCDPSTLLGLLRQRYIQVNGYNRNLITLLHEHEAAGKLDILRERKAVFGPNPLLAASVMAWVPRG